MIWESGITTAPRSKPTIGDSLASIRAAGWRPRIFSDGPCVVECLGHEITQRLPIVGAWPNWWLGLQELYLRNPHADAYAMFQDDILIARHTREYVESLWSDLPSGAGFVNLFVARRRCRRAGDVSPLMTRELEVGSTTSLGIGALAIVFPNDSLRSLLGSTYLINHRRQKKGLENIDGALRRWARKSKRPEVLHHPSLVQHTGSKLVTDATGTRTRNSSLRHGLRSAQAISTSFVGAEFDARELSRK